MDWNLSKCLSVLGSALQLLGLILIAKIDIAQLKASEAQNAIRDSVFSEQYSAAVNGNTYEPSTGEIEAARLDGVAQKKSKLLGVGVWIAAAGAVFQLLGAITAT